MSNFKELVRIGKDAVTRHTSGGKPVTSFSAAFDNGWGDNKQTIWLDVSGWGERYEKIAEYLTKGSQVVVTGDIGTREYEGKTYITLNLSNIQLVAKSRSDGAERNTPPRKQEPSQKPSDDFQDDDIPF
jgi:single-strand DNA-binding protein